MDLIEALRSYQQADEDGVMVLVSRQACDEAADEIERLRAALVSALIDAASTFDAIAAPPERLNGGYDHYAMARQVAAHAATAVREQLKAMD